MRRKLNTTLAEATDTYLREVAYKERKHMGVIIDEVVEHYKKSKKKTK
jgi:hypothetical protein